MTAWDDDEVLRTSCPQIIEPDDPDPMDMDEDRIAALWRGAAAIVEDVAEQTWIVCHCIAAGWSPEQLAGTAAAGWVDAIRDGRPAATILKGVTW